ncbi:MAG: hypothetical protein JSR85_01390 [Proteobacteria bacterium]|nr:hypothetical protein [Pseudomonadota bacterium]
MKTLITFFALALPLVTTSSICHAMAHDETTRSKLLTSFKELENLPRGSVLAVNMRSTLFAGSGTLPDKIATREMLQKALQFLDAVTPEDAIILANAKRKCEGPTEYFPTEVDLSQIMDELREKGIYCIPYTKAAPAQWLKDVLDAIGLRSVKQNATDLGISPTFTTEFEFQDGIYFGCKKHIDIAQAMQDLLREATEKQLTFAGVVDNSEGNLYQIPSSIHRYLFKPDAPYINTPERVIEFYTAPTTKPAGVGEVFERNREIFNRIFFE